MSDESYVLPTRASLRGLVGELRAIREGRDDLDHKRKLLASEILRLLARYEERERVRRQRLQAARKAMAEALAYHGLEELFTTPPSGAVAIETRSSAILAIALLEANVSAGAASTPANERLTPEMRRCRAAFERLLELDVELAALACSLRRLQTEYRRTERRARTLEDVLEPELAALVHRVEEQLDDQDQEESATARYRAKHHGSTRLR